MRIATHAVSALWRWVVITQGKSGAKHMSPCQKIRVSLAQEPIWSANQAEQEGWGPEPADYQT